MGGREEGGGGGEGQIKEDWKCPSLQCRWWEEEEMGKHFAILHNICNGKRINRGELPLKGWKPRDKGRGNDNPCSLVIVK